MSELEPVQGPFAIIRVAGARIALPITVVARMEPEESERQLDLGQLTGLCDATADRPAAVALKTAAGIVNAAVDGLEDLVMEGELQPLPALTMLTAPGSVRGLLYHSNRGGSGVALLMDGDVLSDHIAERLLGEAS